MTEPSGGAWPRRIGWVVGLALASVGVVGAIAEADRTRPVELAAWIVGADLAHDLLWAPAVAAATWTVGRFAPPAWRGPIRFGLGASAVLVLVAWPFVAGYGRDPRVPSLLDRDYGAGLAAYLAVVWVAVLGWVAVDRLRAPRSAGRRRTRRTPPPRRS